jgi:hypothetical protein
MANRRNLKNDVNYLTNELIIEALTYNHFHANEIAREKVTLVIQNILNHRNTLVGRINHVNGKDNSKLTKAHFASIRKDIPLMLDMLDELAKK